MNHASRASTDDVALRDVGPNDVDACFEWMRDPESVAMAAFTSADPPIAQN